MMLGYTDFIDELNFFWTPLMLAVIALTFGCLRVFALESLISCWTPAEFTEKQNAYTHQICWNLENYILPLSNDIPDFHNNKLTLKAHHAFIPIIFILLIPGFKVPQFVQYFFRKGLGLVDVQTSGQAGSVGNIFSMSQILQDIVQARGILRSLQLFVIRILMCLNLLGQFVFLRRYFGFSDLHIKSSNSLIFPKVYHCQFEIRQYSNLRDYIVQCQMPVNYYYEIVVHMLSYWVLLLGIITAVCLILDFVTLLVPPLVKLRFRGLIPERALTYRGCCVDDALLFLEDILRLYGPGVARAVANEVWKEDTQLHQMGKQPAAPGFTETRFNPPGASSVPLLQTASPPVAFNS